MRKILLNFKEIEESKPVDFYCLLCGEYKTIEGNIIEVRNQEDQQLLGLVCRRCFIPSKWNTNVEAALVNAEKKIDFLNNLKTDVETIRVKETPLPQELIE